MDDLISRQMAIKHLKKRLYETALNNNTEHPYYEEMADNRVDVWMNEVPSAQPERRWIPCSERMPDEDYCSSRGVQHSEPVLVTVVNHENDEDIFVDTACTADGEWQLRDDNPLAPEWCEVVAWMPLPKPYESEEKEKA